MILDEVALDIGIIIKEKSEKSIKRTHCVCKAYFLTLNIFIVDINSSDTAIKTVFKSWSHWFTKDLTNIRYVKSRF